MYMGVIHNHTSGSAELAQFYQGWWAGISADPKQAPLELEMTLHPGPGSGMRC